MLCHEFGKQLGEGEPILILSGDKDFVQLQKFVNVDQYDPVRKRKINSKNPFEYLVEHIAKGDRGDGIPNALSKDDVFVSGGRQKPMRATTLAKIKETVDQGTMNGSHDWTAGFERNKMLIDLQYTPSEINEQVLDQFNSQNKDRGKLFNYFVKKKLNNLIENISEF